MLASTLRRNINHGTFQEFQQSLLYTFATHITRDRRIIALAGYLINLINEHNSPFCCSHIIISNLQQTRQDAFNVFTHITCFSKHSGINNGERNIQHLSYCTRQQGFTCTGTTNHDDITLFDFYTIFILWLLQTLVVVIYSDSQIALSLILTDDIFIQVFFDFYRLWHLFENKLTLSSLRSQDSCRLYDFISLLSAIFANEAIDTRNEQSDLVF